MEYKSSLRLVKVNFISENGIELEREQLTDEQYQNFCNAFESARIKLNIIWSEADKRYDIG
jgi:hypothetical protein